MNALHTNLEKIISTSLIPKRVSEVYETLAIVADSYGPRMVGSDGLTKAEAFFEAHLLASNVDVCREDVANIPNWRRGSANATVTVDGRCSYNVDVLALGGSVGCAVSGAVVVVESWSDLDHLGHLGKLNQTIVLFNYDWNNGGYSTNAKYRVTSASVCAKYGALACLVRSLTGTHPKYAPLIHTGITSYNSEVCATKIPAGCVSVAGASLLSRLYQRGVTSGRLPKLSLIFTCEVLSPLTLCNIVGNKIGTHKPDEVVVIGGHLDSWDLSSGAQDDLAGVIIATEAIRLLNDLGLSTQRTIRVVLWTAEEVGLIGANSYATRHSHEACKTVVAMECDLGITAPLVMGMKAAQCSSDAEMTIFRTLIEDIIQPNLNRNGGTIPRLNIDPSSIRGRCAADCSPLSDANIPTIAIEMDNLEEYFYFHHTQADTVCQINPKDLASCVAIAACVMYTYGNLEDTLLLPRLTLAT